MTVKTSSIDVYTGGLDRYKSEVKLVLSLIKNQLELKDLSLLHEVMR